MTHHPSWLRALPSGAVDKEPAYSENVPRMWPRGLRFIGSSVYKARKVFGIGLSWPVKAAQWFAWSYFPHRDTAHGMQIVEHEQQMGLNTIGTLALRIQRIVSSYRHRGTAKREIIRSILSPAYDDCGPDEILFSSPNMDDIIAIAENNNDYLYRFIHSKHAYSSVSTAPDAGVIRRILQRITPGGAHWTAAATKWLLEGMGLNQGVVNEDLMASYGKLVEGLRLMTFALATPIVKEFLNELQDQLKAALGPRYWANLIPKISNKGAGTDPYYSISGYIVTTAHDTGESEIPIDLPVGAIITDMKVVATGEAGTTGPCCRFWTCAEGGTPVAKTLCNWPTSGIGYGNKVETVTDPVAAGDYTIAGDELAYISIDNPTNGSTNDGRVWGVYYKAQFNT